MTSAALCFMFLFLDLSFQVVGQKGGGIGQKILKHVKDIKKSMKTDLSLTLELGDLDLLECDFTVILDGGADTQGCGNMETFTGSASKGQGGFFVVNLPPPGIRTCKIQEITSSCSKSGSPKEPCATFSGAALATPPSPNGFVLRFQGSDE